MLSELLLPPPHRPWHQGFIPRSPSASGPSEVPSRLWPQDDSTSAQTTPISQQLLVDFVTSSVRMDLAQKADARARHLDTLILSKRVWEGWSLHTSTLVMHPLPSASSARSPQRLCPARAGTSLSFPKGGPFTCSCQLWIQCQVFRTQESYPNVFKVFREELVPHLFAVPC